MLSESPHRKIINIIDKIDKCMSKQGYNQYQERFHRINKALMSIQLHSDCSVSNFSVESNQEENQSTLLTEIKEETDMNLYEVKCEPRNPSSTSPRKMTMDQLLCYLETQLNQTEKLLNEEITSQPSTSYQDSRTLFSQKMNANTPIKKNIKNSLSSTQRERLIKKYFKIELRLRTYLEEHEWIQKSSNAKRKPNTALTKQNAFLPYLMKNFFDEKENVQRLVKEMNKRKSVFNQQKLLNEINKVTPKKISRSEKTEFKPHLDIGKTVSCFNIEDSSTIANENDDSNGTQENESSKVGSFFNQSLRNSIFKNKKLMKKQESFAEKSEEYDEEEEEKNCSN